MKSKYTFITLRDRPELMDRAAAWFHEKWRIPTEAYRECMTAYLNRETEYGWYLCLHGERIAGRLLNMAVEDMRTKGITPLYLVTDHTGFYERCGWEFLCMVQGDGEPEMTRMYIHR